MNQQFRHKRHRSLRHKVFGTLDRPRLSVYRSLNHLYVQLIDDQTGRTLIGLNDKKIAPGKNGIARAELLGDAVAKLAQHKKIHRVVFDRGGFSYHGQVKKIAQKVRDNEISI